MVPPYIHRTDRQWLLLRLSHLTPVPLLWYYPRTNNNRGVLLGLFHGPLTVDRCLCPHAHTKVLDRPMRTSRSLQSQSKVCQIPTPICHPFVDRCQGPDQRKETTILEVVLLLLVLLIRLVRLVHEIR